MPTRRRIPVRYVPPSLSSADTQRQLRMLAKSRKLYTSRQYYTRKPVRSYTSKPSRHLAHARKLYGVESVRPSAKLARATGCSQSALRAIVRKGEGAYFSSGSRPNQTAQSWGLARLASSLTAGKSAAVDYHIIQKGCNHKKTAFRLANQARKKFGFGHSATRKRIVST
jgi:hypothetical protein